MGIESKLTAKGQTTIPVEVREKLGLHTGDRIAFIEMEQGYLIVPRNRPVESIFGALAEYAIPGTTTDDYNQAVGEGVSNHVEGSLRGKIGSGD